MSTGRKHKRYLARAHAMGGHTTVPAGETVEVLIELRKRMSASAIAKALGTSHNYVTKVISGDIKRMQPTRHAAIMALQTFTPTDTSHIDPTGAIRRLQALHAMGYSLSRIASEIECYSLGAIKDTIHGRSPVVEAQHVAAISAAYDRLSMSLPRAQNRWEQSGITRARNTAQERGWPPPLAWDNIDDPQEKPHGWAYSPSTRTDQVAELVERGDGLSDVCRHLHLSEKSLEKWFERSGTYATFTLLRDRDRGHSGQPNRNAEREAS